MDAVSCVGTFFHVPWDDSPTEIVLSLSSENGPLDAALQRSALLSGVRRSFVQRRYFSDTTGALYVDRLSVEKSADLALASDVPRYLALAACGALLRYIEHRMDTTFVPRTLRIKLRPNAGILFMDLSSMSSLELVSNLSLAPTLAARKQTLLGQLDHTKTRAGARFLRRNLLEPPCDQPTFEMRQAVVAEVSASEEMYFPASAALENFPDLEGLVSRLTQQANRAPTMSLARAASEASSFASVGFRPPSASSAGTDEMEECYQAPDMNVVRNVLLLKQGLSCIPNLVHALSSARSPLLLTVCETLRSPVLATLWDHIHEVVDEDALAVGTAEQVRLSGAFAVKPGVNGVLDVARKTLTETLDDIRRTVQREKESTRLDKLSMAFSVKRGYHMSVPVEGTVREMIRSLPSSFVEPVQQGKRIHLSTHPLMDLNIRYEKALEEIWLLSNRELDRVVSFACAPSTMGALHRMCDAVAMTDALLGFVTHVSLREGYVRPNFTGADGPIDIKQGRHPILDCISGEECVPNDVFLSSPGTNAMVITGANGSGKSIYLKLVALTCIMAQAGCPVPAGSAQLRTIHRICTRVGTSDSLERSESSFSLEMTEMAGILAALPRFPHGESIGTGSRGSSSDQLLDSDEQDASASSARGANSLIIIDELGRSTSTVDGFAVTWAIMERLAQTPRTFTLLATHFASLCALQKYVSGVAMFHLACAARSANAGTACDGATASGSAGRDRLPPGAALLLGGATGRRGAMGSTLSVSNHATGGDGGSGAAEDGPVTVDFRPTFRLQAGPCTTRGYGVTTAAAAGVPASLIRDALSIRSRLPARVLDEMVNDTRPTTANAGSRMNPFAVVGR